MTQMVEVELEDGTKKLVNVVDTVDALTKKKMREILNVKTIIKGGEEVHEIEDSASKSFELMEVFCKRALRKSDVNHRDLTEDSKMKIASVLKDDLESMGMAVDKKKPGSSQ